MLRRVGWLALLVLLMAAGTALLAGPRGSGGAPGAPAPAASIRASPRSAPTAAAAAVVRAPAPPTPSPAPPPDPLPASPPVIDEGYPVNLERLRAEIPHNRYWVDSVPTDDPQTLKHREADAAAWNQLYGRVLSGTATDVEIRTWFDHRRQVSEDAVEFAGRVLAEHGAELPDRDRGLLELAIDMHRTRLAELPRQESEARDRKAEQDRRRAEWNGGATP